MEKGAFSVGKIHFKIGLTTRDRVSLINSNDTTIIQHSSVSIFNKAIVCLRRGLISC